MIMGECIVMRDGRAIEMDPAPVLDEAKKFSSKLIDSDLAP